MRLRLFLSFLALFVTVFMGAAPSGVSEASYNIDSSPPPRSPKSAAAFSPRVFLRLSSYAESSAFELVLPDEKELLHDAALISRLIWAEARGVAKPAQQAAVGWCVLNRVDDPRWPSTVEEVILQPHQFADISCAPSDDFLSLALHILKIWHSEKAGSPLPGRTLPTDYFYFHGDGVQNHFRTDHNRGPVWDWSLPDPYEQ